MLQICTICYAIEMSMGCRFSLGYGFKINQHDACLCCFDELMLFKTEENPFENWFECRPHCTHSTKEGEKLTQRQNKQQQKISKCRMDSNGIFWSTESDTVDEHFDT